MECLVCHLGKTLSTFARSICKPKRKIIRHLQSIKKDLRNKKTQRREASKK